MRGFERLDRDTSDSRDQRRQLDVVEAEHGAVGLVDDFENTGDAIVGLAGNAKNAVRQVSQERGNTFRGAGVVRARSQRHRLPGTEHETSGSHVGRDRCAGDRGRVRTGRGDDLETVARSGEQPAVGAAGPRDRRLDERLENGFGHARHDGNTGKAPLKYLCMSTLSSAEVVGYPDSKKVAALAGPSYAAAVKGELWARMIVREGTSLDYYDGEDVD